VALSEHNTVVTASSSERWRTVLGTQPIGNGQRGGKVSWEVIVEKCSVSPNLMIGVCDGVQKLHSYLGQYQHHTQSWGYYPSTSPCAYHMTRSNGSYGKTCVQGDIIGVEVDLENGKIAFSHNGENLGTCFSDVDVTTDLYAAVSLYDTGDSVRLRATSSSYTASPSWKAKMNHSPLHYQVPGVVLALHPSKTIGDVEELIKTNLAEGSGSRGAATSPFSVKKLPASTTLKSLSNNQPLVTIQLHDKKRTEEPTTTTTTTNPVELNNFSRIFLHFTQFGGLSLLVKSLLQHFASVTAAAPGDKKLEHLSRWQQWLTLFLGMLKVEEFQEEIAKNPASNELLVAAINQAIVWEEPEGKFQEDIAVDALFDTYYYLFSNDSVPEANKQSVRETTGETSTLALSLLRLFDICDVSPRTPSHPAFEELFRVMKEKNKSKMNNGKNAGSDGRHWAKGTGYGTADDDEIESTWTHEAYIARQSRISQRLSSIVRWCKSFISAPLSNSLYGILKASPLLPFVESYLRTDSVYDMVPHADLYMEIFNLVESLSRHENFLPEIYGVENPNNSIYMLMKTLKSLASVVIETQHTSQKSKEEEKEISLATEIDRVWTILSKEISKWQEKLNIKAQEMITTRQAQQSQELQVAGLAYMEKLEPLQFGSYDMKEDGEAYAHHYTTDIAQDSQTNAEKIRRLRREIRTKLPIHPNSTIFLRVDSSRIDVLKAMITGPNDTPYSNGCFLFDIFCPAEYPRVPPYVNLATTGKGSVRFNPNLYECGKVCLSLLGTWRGGPTEEWNEKTSSLCQVLVSIQSLIFVDLPYFNEPGYESSMNEPEGKAESNKYNQVISIATAQWAMLDMLRNPPKGFEEIVKAHFILRREEVLKDLAKWHKLDKDNQAWKKMNKEIYDELVKLDPETPLALPEDEEEKARREAKEKELALRWEMAETLNCIYPNFPLDLHVEALRLNGDNLDRAMNWVIEQGEAYMASNKAFSSGF